MKNIFLTNLLFEGKKMCHVNISETWRKKMHGMTFVDFYICHQMASLWKIILVTLTYLWNSQICMLWLRSRLYTFLRSSRCRVTNGCQTANNVDDMRHTQCTQLYTVSPGRSRGVELAGHVHPTFGKSSFSDRCISVFFLIWEGGRVRVIECY